jgi:hypothetical protein
MEKRAETPIQEKEVLQRALNTAKMLEISRIQRADPNKAYACLAEDLLRCCSLIEKLDEYAGGHIRVVDQAENERRRAVL